MKRGWGFSLIELMIAIVIMGILLTMGVPSFSTYMANTKLRSVAESIQTGLQRARGEAVAQNANIEFLLTNTDALAANVAAATAIATGRNWMVRTADLATFIEGKQGAEGAGATMNVQVNGGATASVIFTGLGTTTLAAAATIQVTNPAGGSCAPSGPMRCLNIVISPGGKLRLCDPAVTSTSDTRSCT